MTRFQLRAVVRGKEKCLGVARTEAEAERVRPAFEASLRSPVEVVAVEQLPDDEAAWRADAA